MGKHKGNSSGLVESNDFGAYLRSLRKARNLTLQQAAEKVGDISYSYIALLEGGKRLPNSKLLGLFARAYGVKVEELESKFEQSRAVSAEKATERLNAALRWIWNDPQYRTRLSTGSDQLPLDVQIAIVDLYQRASNRNLLTEDEIDALWNWSGQ